MTAVRTDAVLNAALDYAARGLRVVPLYGIRDGGGCECRQGKDCPSAGKHPRVNEWERHATTDEAVIQSWWSRWPRSNVGVHMGQVSNLVDLECDSPEADEQYLRLYDGNPPVVPTYQSKRGKHRLFRWRPDLPNPDKARFRIGTLDVLTGNGAKGQQSVFPPSVREDAEYKWLIGLDEAEPGEITDEVFARLHNLFGEAVPKQQQEFPKSDRQKLYDLPIVPDGQRNDTLYKEACHQWRMYASVRGAKAFHDPDVHGHIYQQVWAWNVAKCKPPLDDRELHTLVESAREFMQRQNFAEKTEETGSSYVRHGLEWRDGEWWPGLWELTVLISEDPVYMLQVPAWKDLLGGEEKQIALKLEEYRSADYVAAAVFRATKTIVLDDTPGIWPTIWNGSRGSAKDKKAPTRGLKAKLFEKAKLEETSADWKKQVMLAEMLLEKLARYKVAEEPHKQGLPIEMPDGGIWIRWRKLWEMEVQTRMVSEHELRMFSRKIGVTPKHSKVWPTTAAKGTSRLRYTVIDPAILGTIRKMTEPLELPKL